MQWGNRDPQTAGGNAKRRGSFRPKTEGLEGRLLMAIDLANTPTAPYGVQLAGVTPAGGDGYSIADVGDVNGDGYDDFLVGAPTVVRNGSSVTTGDGANAKAYLVFGSRSVTSGGVVDWAGLVAQQRTGSLDQTTLGTTPQVNPLNQLDGFTFDGLTFTSSKNPNSLLGASVSSVGDVNGDGINDFMIGAPGGVDANGVNAGTGQAYLVYGSSNLNRAVGSKVIDLDNPPAGINVVTFVNSGASSGSWQTGFAVAGVGDVIADGVRDIAIGAPGATIDGQAGAGAVYVVSGQAVRTATTKTINLNTVGATNGTAGVIIAGATTGDRFGSSISTAGNIDGSKTSGNVSIDDFVIGASGFGSGGNFGAAYLVYGSPVLPSLAITTASVNFINANRIGVSDGTNAIVPGITFKGSTVNGLAGFSVASAGDFNADGLGDFLIGSPGAGANAGLATLIFGKSLASGRIVGQFDLGALPTSLAYVNFRGATTGDLVGYSLSPAGVITSGQPNGVLLGAPGFNNGNGTVYLVPGNAFLQGGYSLATAESQPLAATRIFASSPAGGGAFFGSSVSGRLVPPLASRTMDGDAIGDFVIGASGYGLTPANITSGSVFALQGKYIPVQIPASNAITTTVGIGTPKAPFAINALTPASLDIYVYSVAATATTAAFRPATQINPALTVVNGVSYPTATIRADPIDENGDGITDAIITITPRSNLNLVNGTTSITVRGRTFVGVANSNVPWTGTASNVVVTGANGGGGGGGGGSNFAAGSNGVAGSTPGLASALPPFGGRLVPTKQQLSRLNYKAIPQKVAYQQFEPGVGWRARITGQGRTKIGLNSDNSLYGAKSPHRQLLHKVFTRGLYKKGETIKFTHKIAVIPTQYQSQPK